MSNAAMCMAGGVWTGAQASSGTLGVSSTTIGNNTYALTCGDSAHSARRVFATLDVTAASAF